MMEYARCRLHGETLLDGGCPVCWKELKLKEREVEALEKANQLKAEEMRLKLIIPND